MKAKIISLFAIILLSIWHLSGYAANENDTKTDLVIQPDKIFDPNQLSVDSVAMYEKNFTIDWDEDASAKIDQKKIQDVEDFIKTATPQIIQSLPPADKEAYGKILLKLGTYYTHANRNDLAISRLQQSLPHLHEKTDKAWAYNHLASIYSVKFTDEEDDNARTKAISYADKVINLYSKANNKEIAFAYSIKGIVENEDKNFGNAERYFEKAIKIYESLPNGKDDQYAKTSDRLAAVILSMNDRDQEAIKRLEQLKQYWAKKANAKQNPYAARNLLWLGQAYLKIGNTKEALEQINAAISVYQNVYGAKSTLLIKPYHLLSTAYKIIGDNKLADDYEEKASTLDKNTTS